MKKLFKLENLIYLSVFSLPLYLGRFRLGPLPVNVLEILLSVTIFWWLVSLYEKNNLKNLYSDYRKYFLAGGLLFISLLLSAVLHAKTLSSLNIFLNWFLLPVGFVLVAADVVPREKMKRVFWVYGLSAWAVAIVSLVYLFLGKVTYDGRLEAFFNSPNYLAMYLAPGAAIFFVALLGQFQRGKKDNKNKIVVSLVGFLVIILAIYKTYSYGAWLALAGSCFLMLAILKKISPRKIIVFLMIIAVLVFLQSRTVKFKDLLTQNPRSSLASRQMIWRASFKMIEDNPILGIGPANFQETYLEYQKFFPPYLEWAVPHPQSLYLDFWLSGGIFGILGFFGVAFFFLRDILKNKNRDIVAVLALGIMLYILIHGLFDSTYFKNDLAVIFWLNFLALKR